jgi:hypothetical protein
MFRTTRAELLKVARSENRSQTRIKKDLRPNAILARCCERPSNRSFGHSPMNMGVAKCGIGGKLAVGTQQEREQQEREQQEREMQ